MPTQVAGDRLKSGLVVLSAIDEFRSRALPRLEQRPVSEGRSPPDYGPTLDSLGDQLSWASDNVFTKDTAYIYELSNDQKYLRERDETGQDLVQVMVRSRNIFDNCYQPVNIEEFGFPRRVSRDPELFNQQLWQLDARLREPDLPLPEPLAPELAVAPVVIADVLKPRLERYDQVLKKVRHERRGAQLASLERNEALDFFDQTLLWVARTAESLFNLAGEKELAKRVRPSTTRPGRTETDPDVILAETGQTAETHPDHPAFLPVVADPAKSTDFAVSETSTEA